MDTLCKKINLQALIYNEDDIDYVIQSLQEMFNDYKQREEIECILRIVRKEVNTIKEGIKINVATKEGNKIKVITVCGIQAEEVEKAVFSALRKIRRINEKVAKATKKYVNIEDDGRCVHVYIVIDDFLASYCCSLR